MNKKYAVISLIVLAAIIVAATVLYSTRRTQLPNQNQPTAQNQPAATPAAPAAPQSLGGQIYEQAANPVGNKLPDVNPAKNANPIQGLNVNPF